MSIILYKIKDKEIFPTDEIKLSQENIYIIVDKHMKRPKIWVWSGSEADKLDRYFAGMSATRIKSKERLYGASIEVVESGNEPESFPVLESNKMIKRDQISFQDIEEEVEKIASTGNKSISEVRTNIEIDKADVKSSESRVDISTIEVDSSRNFKKNTIIFLKDLMVGYKKISDKIQDFLDKIE